MAANATMDACDVSILVKCLKAVAEPAIRHRCEWCKTVFVCHLCRLGEDEHHLLHKGGVHAGDYQRICEDCIERNGWWVAIRRFKAERDGWEGYGGMMCPDLSFYDHMTGEFIGIGVFRNTSLKWVDVNTNLPMVALGRKKRKESTNAT